MIVPFLTVSKWQYASAFFTRDNVWLVFSRSWVSSVQSGRNNKHTFLQCRTIWCTKALCKSKWSVLRCLPHSYSMEQIVKPCCVCLSVNPFISHCLIDFHQNWHKRLRSCATKYVIYSLFNSRIAEIVIGTVRSLWIWLWSRYHVSQNVFLVVSWD